MDAPGVAVDRPGLKDLDLEGLFLHSSGELRVPLLYHPQKHRKRHERPGLRRYDPEIRIVRIERRVPGEVLIEVEDGFKRVAFLQFHKAVEREP